MSKNNFIDCENNLCLYWKNNFCRLNKITVNECGMCTDCIHINLPNEMLNVKRKEQFEKLEGVDY